MKQAEGRKCPTSKRPFWDIPIKKQKGENKSENQR